MSEVVDKGRRELQLTSGIYCIENNISKKKYIGSTLHLPHRKRQHFSALKQGKYCNAHLQSSWKKYGEKAFIFYIVEYCEKDLLESREDFYIKLYKPIYNKREAGRRGEMSEETRSKMRANWKRLRIGITYRKSDRKVSVYDIEGNFIEELPNPQEVCKKYKIRSVYQYILKNRNYLYDKYQLFYSDDVQSGKVKVLNGYKNKRFSKIKVTNILTKEEKIFASCNEAKSFINISANGFQTAIREDRICKKIYKLEYYD